MKVKKCFIKKKNEHRVLETPSRKESCMSTASGCDKCSGFREHQLGSPGDREERGASRGRFSSLAEGSCRRAG